MSCWLKKDKSFAKGDSEIELTFGENGTGYERSAIIRVTSSDGKIVKEYKIVQNYVMLFSNERRTLVCQKQCGNGGVSEPVELFVEEGIYRKPSIEEANRLADEDLAEQCAEYQASALCYYGNDVIEREVQKNDCIDDGIGDMVMYTVPAGKYTSNISKDDANNKAEVKFKPNGDAQKYANENGGCTWYNDNITKDVRKDDCLVTEEGSLVPWTVNKGQYSSKVSKDDANKKALVEFEPGGKGQENANEKGSCRTVTWYNREYSADFPVTKCTMEHFHPVPDKVRFTVEAGKYVWNEGDDPVDGKTGQEAVDQMAINDANANGPSYANLPENSSCEEGDFVLGTCEKTFRLTDCPEHFHSNSLTVNQDTHGVIGKPFKNYDMDQEAANSAACAAVDDFGQKWLSTQECIEDQKWEGHASKQFTKTCPNDGAGDTITLTEADLTAEQGKPFYSYISLEDANSKALAALTTYGQAIADAKSDLGCTWIGEASDSVQRDNCQEGFVGSWVSVDVSMTDGYPNNVKSRKSKADADTIAIGVLDREKQDIANRVGTCEEREIFYGFYQMPAVRDNCEDCKTSEKNQIVTSDDVFGINQFPAFSKAEADAAARHAMETEKSEDDPSILKVTAWVRKNVACITDKTLASTPNWVDARPEVSECRNGKSWKKQINDNKCYTGTLKERWVEGGSATCIFYGVGSRSFTPTCPSVYNGTTYNGRPSGNVTITEVDLAQYGPFEAYSQSEANALVTAALDAHGLDMANSKAISSGMCTWEAEASKSGLSKTNCGSCEQADDRCKNKTVTSTQIKGEKIKSTTSYKDAYESAVRTVNNQAQAWLNKNCEYCEDANLEAQWTVVGTSDECRNCKSMRLHKDTNPCSGTYNQTSYREYGTKDCSESGTWGNWSYTGSCNGCTRPKSRTNSCGKVQTGSDDCTTWNYYGTGDCVGHTRYDAYRNSCTGEVNNRYTVDCNNCCNCGSYGSWSEVGCSGTRVSYERYDDCGRRDTKTEYVCGKCGHVCDWTSTKTNNTRYCREDCECGPSACAELRKYSATATSTISQADADNKAQAAANKKAEDASKTMACKTGCQELSIVRNDVSNPIPCNGSTTNLVYIKSINTESGSSLNVTATSNVSWITNANAGTTGGGPTGSTHVLSFVVPKNPTTTSRTGTITLTQPSSGKTLSVSVTQSGCEDYILEFINGSNHAVGVFDCYTDKTDVLGIKSQDGQGNTVDISKSGNPEWLDFTIVPVIGGTSLPEGYQGSTHLAAVSVVDNGNGSHRDAGVTITQSVSGKTITYAAGQNPGIKITGTVKVLSQPDVNHFEYFYALYTPVAINRDIYFGISYMSGGYCQVSAYIKLPYGQTSINGTIIGWREANVEFSRMFFYTSTEVPKDRNCGYNKTEACWDISGVQKK